MAARRARYPLRWRRSWKGAPQADAFLYALRSERSKMYVFIGQLYLRYDMLKSLDFGYPRQISTQRSVRRGAG